MESEPNQDYQQEELNDDDLVFKPIVKYAAIGLGLVVLLGVEYATYRLGFSQGFTAGVTSEVVSEAVNTAAVNNLTHFMQVATSDDATLLATVRNRNTELAWIKNDKVRREAEWTLALALVNRHKAAEAAELLKTLFGAAEKNELWAHRALIVARAMADESRPAEALRYYRYAAAAYAAKGRSREQLTIYSEMAALVAAPSDNPREQLEALERLQKEVAALGDSGKPLQADLLAHMGRIHRAHGRQEQALSCFEQALAGADLSKMPTLAGAAVSMGSALLEKGDVQRAEQLLRDGVSRLGEHPADAAYLAAALRDLARIELELGNAENALALLYRAEGAAMGRMNDNSVYWLCLYDQRGWIHLTKGSHESALADFDRALAQNGAPEELRAQPLEGAGTCCLTLGRVEDAARYLKEAVELRKKHFSGDKPAIGRVYLRLAQAYDLTGSTREAANTYALAIEHLPQVPGEDSDYFNALMARAYALSQIKDWNTAIQAWDALRPLVTKGGPRAREVEEQFALCRRYGATLPEEVDADDATEAPADDEPAQAAQ